MANQKVKRIQFDLFYKGKWHKNLTMDYDESDDVSKGYIYDEDGPWYMLQVDDDVIDFQVFSPDGDTLSVDACEMFEENGVYHHGDILERPEDYDFANIQVEYYPTTA